MMVLYSGLKNTLISNDIKNDIYWKFENFYIVMFFESTKNFVFHIFVAVNQILN